MTILSTRPHEILLEFSLFALILQTNCRRFAENLIQPRLENSRICRNKQINKQNWKKPQQYEDKYHFWLHVIKRPLFGMKPDSFPFPFFGTYYNMNYFPSWVDTFFFYCVLHNFSIYFSIIFLSISFVFSSFGLYIRLKCLVMNFHKKKTNKNKHKFQAFVRDLNFHWASSFALNKIPKPFVSSFCSVCRLYFEKLNISFA